ncbi:MAG TPA: ABC transporter substrate-binding protein [Acholeplasmataceae bacterium]|nr:ABC transporter substrate-binding protein [Acholeplasmataceae bacterium]
MKKIITFATVLVALFIISGCSKTEKLYVLNWAQYINGDLITKFEKENNVKIILDDTADSNEIMYTRIKNRTQPYDIVIPSDYMIDRLKQENLLEKIDYSLLRNYDKNNFDPKVNSLMDETNSQEYSIPYFWGTLGIMYNKTKEGAKEAVEANSWDVFFEKDKMPAGSRVGMYLSSRDAIAAAELYLKEDLNSKEQRVFDSARDVLKNFKYTHWGTDDLKELVAQKNLDVALVYSGDFFDVLYNYLDNEMEITFDMFVPQDRNNVWYDSMVIPTTSKNKELAHKFIDFFLDEDNALENASAIGYCPTLSGVYQQMLLDESIVDVVTHPGYYPGGVNGVSFQYLGSDIHTKMDDILTDVRS